MPYKPTPNCLRTRKPPNCLIKNTQANAYILSQPLLDPPKWPRWVIGAGITFAVANFVALVAIVLALVMRRERDPVVSI